jgi:hypothetical protein
MTRDSEEGALGTGPGSRERGRDRPDGWTGDVRDAGPRALSGRTEAA